MQIPMTEYLVIDLDSELWVCRVCRHELGSARGNYKEGTLVYDRDPREIHQPIIDPDRYEFTFSPDPAYCRILEYYCPGCGTQIETEYIPPGHPRPSTWNGTSTPCAPSGSNAAPIPDRSSRTAPARTPRASSKAGATTTTSHRDPQGTSSP